MANGAYVGSRRASHLPCNRKTDGTYTSLPMGFGTILVNLPWSGAITQPGAEAGPISVLYDSGIANELFPLLLFIGIGAIMVAAYSYMALVPIVQPPVIKAVTSKKERLIRMKYNPGDVSKTTKILFPIVVTVIAGLVAPKSVALLASLCLVTLSENAVFLIIFQKLLKIHLLI